MPGLIDAHWHSIFAALPVSALVSADVGYIFLATSSKAERTLLRGFTTVRDLGVFCFEASDRLEVDKRAARPLDPFDFSGTQRLVIGALIRRRQRRYSADYSPRCASPSQVQFLTGAFTCRAATVLVWLFALADVRSFFEILACFTLFGIACLA
jgi:hypothetical protein